MTADAPLSGIGRPRRAEVTDLVLGATRDLIRDQGYARTSVDQIAARAGVAKTTVYRRWPTKSTLAVDAFVDAVGPLPTPQGDWHEGLLGAVSWLAERVSDPMTRRLLLGLQGEAADDSALRQQLWVRIRAPYEEVLVVTWGVERADAHLAFDVVVGSILQHATMNGAVSQEMIDVVARLAAELLAPTDKGPGGRR